MLESVHMNFKKCIISSVLQDRSFQKEKVNIKNNLNNVQYVRFIGYRQSYLCTLIVGVHKTGKWSLPMQGRTKKEDVDAVICVGAKIKSIVAFKQADIGTNLLTTSWKERVPYGYQLYWTMMDV